MQLPAKQKEIVIGQNSYVATFPNNRGLMSIYSRKAQLSRETYDALKYGLDGNSRYVSMLIDAVSTLEVIMPEQFTKDLNFKNILDGDVLAGAELVKVYQDSIQEWFGQWTDAIAGILNPKVAEPANA